MIKLDIGIKKPHRKGTFLRRLNRFVAEVDVNGKIYKAHLHDSGRLGELLIEGRPIMLIPHQAPKTSFKVIAINREGYGWVLLNSGLHRRIVEDILSKHIVEEFKDIISYKAEYPIDKHRIDFMLNFGEYNALMEVKGCTLFEGDTCLFPDAPTKRGAEHVKILTQHRPSFITFLVCHKDIKTVVPNCKEDPLFCQAITEAVNSGVRVVPLKVHYQDGDIFYAGKASFLIPEY